MAAIFGSLVEVVFDDPRASEWYIGSFAKCDQDVAGCATVASIVAHISDASFLELLEDDRVAKRLSNLEEAVRDEMDWPWNR